jgi:uncharacterized protein
MKDIQPPFSKSLLVEIRRQYRLDWNGLHGASHWARVLEKGLHLCDATSGLRQDVVVLFALLHDACRHDDGVDAEHGARAAEFARQLHGRHFHLDPEGLDLLVEACRTHTGGRIPAHPTIMACWDSDRLDLPRIFGVQVRPEWLGTEAARDPKTVAWATKRAKERAFPWSEALTEPDITQFSSGRALENH